MIPKHRPPTHPGEMLLEFLKPMAITQQAKACAIATEYQRINELVNGKRGITASTALRLARFFLETALNSGLTCKMRGNFTFSKQKAQQLESIIPRNRQIDRDCDVISR